MWSFYLGRDRVIVKYFISLLFLLLDIESQSRNANAEQKNHKRERGHLYKEWINNKVLLYSTGHYIQYPVIKP